MHATVEQLTAKLRALDALEQGERATLARLQGTLEQTWRSLSEAQQGLVSTPNHTPLSDTVEALQERIARLEAERKEKTQYAEERAEERALRRANLEREIAEEEERQREARGDPTERLLVTWLDLLAILERDGERIVRSLEGRKWISHLELPANLLIAMVTPVERLTIQRRELFQSRVQQVAGILERYRTLRASPRF